MPPKKDPLKARAEEQRVKNLERALKEERLGLIAICRVLIEESDVPPARILARLESMARAPGKSHLQMPQRTRDAILHGHAVMSRALEQLQGRPQGLFDPHVGHISPKKVERITEVPQEPQMGFGATERNPLGDVPKREELSALTVIQEGIVKCYDNGPLSDKQLLAEYIMRFGRISQRTIIEARVALTKKGRVIELQRDGERRWTLIEQKQLAQ